MSTICDDLRAAVLQALIPDPDKCPEEKRGHLVKLSDLPLTYMRGNGLRKNDVIENGSKKCVLYGELFTKHTEGIIEEDNLSSTNVISNVVSKSGDILIPGTSTASKEVMLRACELYIDGVQIGGDINIIRPNANLFYPKYMSYVFDTFSSKRQLFEYITGTTGIIHISNSGIKNLVFYLPSIEEQKRIVEKIDELMARVADLEQSADALASLKKTFPDDVKASLLQAAMQGKLTKQLPEDDAKDLLDQIKAEKEKLVAEGKIKKYKPLAPIADDEIPFSIPENWQWVRLGDIATLNPKNNLDDSIEASFIPMALVSGGYNNSHTYEIKKWGKIKKGFTHFANGDIGIAKITPCFQNKKSVIFKDLVNGVGSGTTELSIVRPYPPLNNVYLLWIFKSPDFIEKGMRSVAGTAGQQRIDKDYIKNYLIPLPPLTEQKRIVERLDTLMQNINAVGDLIVSE